MTMRHDFRGLAVSQTGGIDALMSDGSAGQETLGQLMKRPAISIGAAFVAVGFAGLVVAVGYLCSLPQANPKFDRLVAELPLKPTTKPASSDRAMAMPAQEPTATPLAVGLPPRPEAPLPQSVVAEPSAIAAEAAVATASPLSGPLASAEPVPSTETVAREITPTRARPTAFADAPSPLAAGGKGYRLQLGAMRTPESAREEWDRLERQNADLLGKLAYAAPRVDLGSRGVFYRIQVGPVTEAAAADRTCNELKRRGVGCILVKP